jgi:hypothetical protein
MACPEPDSNHLSPLQPRCQTKAEPAGVLTDEYFRPRRLALLLCSPALAATWRAFEIPWSPAICTRVATWTSYRGQDCENRQARALDVKQGVGQREISGYVVNPGGTPGGCYTSLPTMRQDKFSFPTPVLLCRLRSRKGTTYPGLATFHRTDLGSLPAQAHPVRFLPISCGPGASP